MADPDPQAQQPAPAQPQYPVIQVPMAVAIVTYELRLYNNQPAWLEATTHTFSGASREELAERIEAHKQDDAYFRDSFTGKHGDVMLQNGPLEAV